MYNLNKFRFIWPHANCLIPPLHFIHSFTCSFTNLFVCLFTHQAGIYCVSANTCEGLETQLPTLPSGFIDQNLKKLWCHPLPGPTHHWGYPWIRWTHSWAFWKIISWTENGSVKTALAGKLLSCATLFQTPNFLKSQQEIVNLRSDILNSLCERGQKKIDGKKWLVGSASSYS